MDLEQTKILELTMQLDLKAKEYKVLCKKLEELEKQGIPDNNQEYIKLRELFQKNNDEINKIKEELEKLA